ncbi:putative Receptor protein kinase [Melia azedarach]|uniref:Receptor protein kinase n=1 Tax=Melia azedarach TaxID=155640 RepID=A0ACC1Y6U7_MELAZ|nr:putative Receptor protein kinase [Melia azedarach]
MMNWILRKSKQREDRAMLTMRNGETVLKELIAASNGKYNPFRIFSAQELKIATNNYDENNYVNKYFVYKGFWNERPISVMNFQSHIKDYAYKFCINNIIYASQMSHKHILRLIGCCLETEIPILVFESVEDVSLVDLIHGPPPPHFEPLLLPNRLKIAMDIAHAVAYLHVGFPRPVIFRAIKPSHILFTEENVAKLFDFSLSESIPEGQTHIKFDVVMGAIGYAAPEYVIKREMNEKSDVYSFGVLLLELLTGKKVYDKARAQNSSDEHLQYHWKKCDGDEHLVYHVKKYIENNRFIEIVDPIIIEDRSWPKKEKEQKLQAFQKLIFQCVAELPEDRPTMVDVAKQLRQMYRT